MVFILTNDEYQDVMYCKLKMVKGYPLIMETISNGLLWTLVPKLKCGLSDKLQEM